MCPNLSPISPTLMLYMGTKVDDTMKLNIHWNATAMATAAPRMVLGKISAISTQHIGPQENINDAEYTIMLITEMIGGNDTMLQSNTKCSYSHTYGTGDKQRFTTEFFDGEYGNESK